MVDNVPLCGMWTKRSVAFGSKRVEDLMNELEKNFGGLVVTIRKKHTFWV